MTLRILFRRVKVLPLRILPSSLHFSCVSAVFSRPPSLLHPYLTGRLQPFSISSTRCVTFSIQDGEDFTERVLNSQLPVLVDFHAQWCGPCKILGPRLEKMVAKQNGKVTMAKVDIDDHTDLAIEYGVSAVPTVLAVKNGNVIDKFVGIKDEDQLDAFIRKLIGP